jgi:hypothetical protein
MVLPPIVSLTMLPVTPTELLEHPSVEQQPLPNFVDNHNYSISLI